ncbi:MAG: hypothetical protein N3A62_06395 [Thermodesulfovibrionales bacterium]|nr:hypothetical protein [Thermodesulfovibrionales bacterium]
MQRQKIDIAEIKELASRFTLKDLEWCITQQIEAGENICKKTGDHMEIINELAKANFVRELVEKGTPLNEAIRELARRIRAFKENTEDKTGQ